MPIFEYKCTQCGQIDEVLVRSASSKAPACAACGAKTEKQFSSFAAVVKESPAASAEKCHACPNAGGCPNAMG